MSDSLPRRVARRTTLTSIVTIFSAVAPGLVGAQPTYSPPAIVASHPVKFESAGTRYFRSASPDSTPLYFEYQVDEPVTVKRGQLIYPPELKAKKVGGSVVLLFVVDSSGHVERGSERVVRSSRPEFTAAAMTMLGSARLTPAVRKGSHVRQVVQQAFVFAPRR